MTIIDESTKTIYHNRGDKLEFDFDIPVGEEFYHFRKGDKIRFGVYNKMGMDGDPLLLEEFIIDEECDTYRISISAEKMKIGKLINKEKDYWYEIILNDDTTVVGYDDEKAKILQLWPEGKDIKKEVML